VGSKEGEKRGKRSKLSEDRKSVDGELREDYILPSIFNPNVSEKILEEVREAAIQTGVARLEHRYLSFYKV
jgi:malic enzyme